MFTKKAAPRPETNGIPRALPHKAPPSIQEQLDRLRRWCLLLGGSLALLLVATLAAFAFFRTARPDQEEEKAAPTTEKEPKKSEKRAPSLKSELAPAPKRLTIGPDVSGREPLLETIGGLSIVHLYQSYLNIGLLADAVENETYTRAEAASIMATVNELVNLVEKQLTKLPAGGLSEEDETALAGVRLLTGLLRTQSTSLLAFWASSEETHAERYHETRDQSWTILRKFLDLDEE